MIDNYGLDPIADSPQQYIPFHVIRQLTTQPTIDLRRDLHP